MHQVSDKTTIVGAIEFGTVLGHINLLFIPELLIIHISCMG